jgi:hypothetical protein
MRSYMCEASEICNVLAGCSSASAGATRTVLATVPKCLNDVLGLECLLLNTEIITVSSGLHLNQKL